MMTALPLLFSGLAYAADRDVAVTDLPKAVTDAVMKVHPNAKLIKAEEETKNGEKYYEIKVHDGQTEREIHVRPDGTVIHDELDED
jgi:uncharacterized membrane protein YkoI